MILYTEAYEIINSFTYKLFHTKWCRMYTLNKILIISKRIGLPTTTLQGETAFTQLIALTFSLWGHIPQADRRREKLITQLIVHISSSVLCLDG
jgi:hypothetical protein